MESIVDGRALNEGERENYVRATAPRVDTPGEHAGAMAAESRRLDAADGRAWHDGAATAGCRSQVRGLTEVAFDTGVAARVGKPRPLDLIERIDHDSISSIEVLELLLYFGKVSQSAGPIAQALLEHFGSLGAILAADPARLVGFLNGDHTSVFLLKVVRVAARITLREPLEDRPVISSASALMDYLSATMRHEATEATRVLFLDRKNALIKDETLNRGTVDHTPLYPREVVRRVIETGASAIILVHNHPSGDPSPSQSDIEMTRNLMAALGTIGGVLHDHVIVGRNKELSFRKSGLI
jgi:DNA repair protein RadC